MQNLVETFFLGVSNPRLAHINCSSQHGEILFRSGESHFSSPPGLIVFPASHRSKRQAATTAAASRYDGEEIMMYTPLGDWFHYHFTAEGIRPFRKLQEE